MIYIVDVCKDWTHEDLNTGMVNTIEEVFPGNKIALCAEKKQLESLKNRGMSKKIKTVELTFPSMNTVGALKPLYESKLKRFLKRLKPGDYVFSLASEKPLIAALCHISKKNPKVKFFLILHGTMELVLEQKSLLQRWKTSNLIQTKGWQKKWAKADDILFPIERSIKKSVRYPNIHFITFGPCAIEEFNKIFSADVVKKFHFLHIPILPLDVKQAEHTISDKIKIGVWGNCVNDNVSKIISYVNRKTSSDKYEFVILKKKHIKIKKSLKNTVIYEPDGSGFTKEEMHQHIQNFDYALIPYSRDKYRVSCSGILADAIAYQLPILALVCAPCSYYSDQFHIGYVEKTIASLGDRIIRLIEGERSESANQLSDVAEKMHQENLNIMRAMI